MVDTTYLDANGDSCRFKFTVAVIPQLSNFASLGKALIDHSYNRDLLPLPIVARSNIREHQIAGKILVIFILSRPENSPLQVASTFCLKMETREMGLPTIHWTTSMKLGTPITEWSMQP